jgi:hypothetical protein
MTKTAPRQTEMSSSRKRTHGRKRGGGPGLNAGRVQKAAPDLAAAAGTAGSRAH